MPQGASNGAAPMRWILTTGDLPQKAVSLVHRRVVEVPVNPRFSLGQVVSALKRAAKATFTESPLGRVPLRPGQQRSAAELG